MIRLIVQADDFGMCHAVNTGVVRAFEEGIVTQTSVMAPCPWIGEAISLAKSLGIPAGMHCTLTCEWEHLRWGPITAGESLRDADGGFWRTVAGAREHVNAAEARAELAAQADRLLAAGLPLHYFDAHMGPTCPSAFEHVCVQYGRPFMYPLGPAFVALDSIEMLSAHPGDEKRDWLLGYLDGLEAGLHFIVSHPGEAGEELRSLTPQANDNHAWAETIRASDLEILCDAAMRRAVEARGIELVSVADLAE